MKEVVILSGVRTAIGSFGGSLANVNSVKLGETVIKEAVKRANIKASDVGEVYFGCVLQAGLGQNVARRAAINAGISAESPAVTINVLCGSGLKSVSLAAQAIATGETDIAIAGGVENMSLAPYLIPKARFGLRMGDGTVTDSMIKDGLWCAFNNYHMGVTAENIAKQWKISREEQDEFALYSQQKALNAIANYKFKEEIVPVEIKVKGETKLFEQDEYPKATTAEKLKAMKPAFLKDGTVTAGNASGINDGAAALVLASAQKAKELGIIPMAKYVAGAWSGVDPSIMGIGPVQATTKVLEKASWKITDLDLIEANEAFASQALAVAKELNLPKDKLNVNGGAIALGHPIGASGARILVTLLYEMQKRNVAKGLATLCVGGGQGVSVLIER